MPELLRGLSLPMLALVVFAYFGGLTILSLLAGFASERVLANKRIFAVPLSPGQYRFEAIGNVVFVATTTVTLTALLQADVVRFGPPGWGRGVATFFALSFGFQIFYWFFHRALHTRALLFLHRWHHRSRVTTPLSGQSVSLGEALGWMLGYAGLPLLLSWIEPISFGGYVAYLGFNVFGNIVGHANVEPTAPRAATRMAALFANPFVYHALHHARWTVNYSFQAAGMDRMFKTEAPDWPELYRRVSTGHPLQSLQERGEHTALRS